LTKSLGLTEKQLDDTLTKFLETEEIEPNVPIDVESLKKQYGDALVELLKDPKV
jgi:hypothetical protein